MLKTVLIFIGLVTVGSVIFFYSGRLDQKKPLPTVGQCLGRDGFDMVVMVRFQSRDMAGDFINVEIVVPVDPMMIKSGDEPFNLYRKEIANDFKTTQCPSPEEISKAKNDRNSW